MSTKRVAIRNTLAELLKDQLDGTQYASNCWRTVETSQQFWDEIKSYPSISVICCSEKLEYLPSAFKWYYLNILIKVYTKIDDVGSQAEQFIEDIEAILDANNSLEYETGKTTELISLLSIETDEGLLEPFQVSELSLLVQYDNNIY